MSRYAPFIALFALVMALIWLIPKAFDQSVDIIESTHAEQLEESYSTEDFLDDYKFTLLYQGMTSGKVFSTIGYHGLEAKGASGFLEIKTGLRVVELFFRDDLLITGKEKLAGGEWEYFLGSAQDEVTK